MDSEQDISADEAQAEAYGGVGARLRAAREARRLELTQVAAETRIPLRHLEVIEAGEFAALPSRAYAIGFTRTFAKAVGLDDALITEAVREELADGNARRAMVPGGMEPGDPAKLPSAGLAWVGAFAALVLAVGLIAFFSTRFGAGVGPAPLTAPSPEPTAATTTAAPPAATAIAGGPVVFTALADVWVRIYEEGGARLIEKQLKQGESFTLPPEAADPRINTGRPDLLAITVGGKPVPALAATPAQISGVPVSAAALLARAQPPVLAATPGAIIPAPAQPTARRTAPQVAEQMPAAAPATEVPAEPAATQTPGR